ncbi:GHKL domain-containing protein [Intestinibacter bartlettii]|uniref:Sensor histidine kinase NatK-like C-terminal domain-containing protein n=1 Tax=Intestinibacter bartlettii TaxID=261299 RepID=A0A6N3BXG1_9FIRM
MLRNVYILAVLNMIIFIVLFFMLMNKKGYSYQYKFEKIYIATSIFLILTSIKGLGFGETSIQQMICMFLNIYLICRVFYNCDIRKSIFTSLIYSLIYILVGCSIFWFTQITLIKMEYIIEITLIGSTIIFLISIHFFNVLEKLYINNKYYIYIALTTIINLLIILYIYKSDTYIGNLYGMVVKNNLEFSYFVELLRFSSTVKETFPYILVIVSILLISIFLNSIKSEKEKAKKELVNEKLDMQYKYYLMVKDSQEKMKQVYHDMNNHMENIRSLKNSSEDVNKYINNIEDEVRISNNIYNTGNVLLDIIFYEKSKLCMERNINFKVGIDFSKCDFIEMIDISSIFSNLVDNAIEACNKIDDDTIEKYITIKGTLIKGYYVVRCENSKSNKLIIKNNKIITSKKDKFLHGIGIDSIRSSVRKYNGELKIKDSDYKFVATIHIPLE